MGANISLPDGSELKLPEERIPHDVLVRANIALVFVKPAACTDKCCAFVREELAKEKGLLVLGECKLSGPEIEAGNLVDKHYAEIAKAALSTDPSDLALSDLKKEEFNAKFGTAWDAAVANHEVLNARDCALKLGTHAATDAGAEDEPLQAKDLFNMWAVSPVKLKVAPGAYVAKIKGPMPKVPKQGEEEEDNYNDEEEEAQEEANLWVVDGFYPAMREKFLKEESSIMLYVVGFDPHVLNWAKFRGEVIGATNPADAAPTSLRAKIKARWEQLDLANEPDNTDNGVHASAGPLEALKERITWLNFPLAHDPTGNFLVELAVWDEQKHHVLDMLLENPLLEVAGSKGKAFDLTEDKDTSDLYIFANNVAFVSQLEGL